MPDLGEVGRRVRTARTQAGLSLAQLADASGVSKAYLVRLEKDESTNPSLDLLARVAEALDTTVADLVGRPPLRFAQDENLVVPPTLQAFADEAGLGQRELQTLASIRWRKGDEPQTVDRWRYIWQSLRASKQFDHDKDRDGAA